MLIATPSSTSGAERLVWRDLRLFWRCSNARSLPRSNFLSAIRADIDRTLCRRAGWWMLLAKRLVTVDENMLT